EASPAFVPNDGSLASNLSPPGIPPFDTFAVLANEGQAFTNLLDMTAARPVNVVFSGNLISSPYSGRGWTLTFARKTFANTSSVPPAAWPNGSTYTSMGCWTLTSADPPFSVSLPRGSPPADVVYVRLGLDPAGGQPIIDNVALTADLAIYSPDGPYVPP